MVTYDEFMQSNKHLKALKELHIGKKSKETALSWTEDVRATILGNPAEYLDVAQKAQELETIIINSTEIHDKEWYEAVRSFVRNCKENIQISNVLAGSCTKEEFFAAEDIIEGIVNQIKPEWNAKQKLAFVHFKMGELVTYMADYPANSKPPTPKCLNDVRNIWKSLTSGITVCNGVTYIERSILSRVGVTTKELSSGVHRFMLTETEDGNIITDATWDLSSTAFGCRPQYFGKTYEEFRQIDGTQSNAHRLQEIPENIIGISSEELKEIYYSIGIIGEDRKFNSKISELLDEMNSEEFASQEDRTKRLWELIEEKIGDKFSHIEECKSMIENCLRWNGVDIENVTSQYVYAPTDNEFRQPKLVISVKENDDTRVTKIIDPNGDSVFDISLESLHDNFRYHKNNTQEPFWESELKRKNEAERESPENSQEYKS